MLVKRCNLCGKEFDEFDNQEGFSISNEGRNTIGYGSAHDGETCRCDLCCSCFDKIMGTFTFEINPFSDDDEVL